MNKVITSLLTLCILVCLCCATTGSVKPSSEANTDPQVDQSTSKDDEELVCKRETPPGSHIAHKVCRYKNQEKGRAERDQEQMRDMTSKSALPESAGH